VAATAPASPPARITQQLPALLARDGVTRISEVIGVDVHA
jgi:hypothetical protein